MKDRIRKLLRRAAYPALYLAMFFICLSLTFPYNYVRTLLVSAFNANAAASGGHDELRIDSLSGYWFSGISMTGLHLRSVSTDATKESGEWTAEHVVARVSLLPLLIGRKNVSFAIDAYDGTMSGDVSDHGGDLSLDVTLAGVDLGNVKALGELLGIPFVGKVSGTLKLELPQHAMHKATGSLALTIDELAVGDGKAKLKGALALPRVSVGTMTLTGDVRDGNVRISKVAASGKDVELAGDGKIVLRETPTDSQVDMNVRFKINDAYRTRSEIATSLFGAPGSTVPALFELADPRVKQSKRADGFYGWTVHGPMSRLDFTAAGGAASGSSAPPSGSREDKNR